MLGQRTDALSLLFCRSKSLRAQTTRLLRSASSQRRVFVVLVGLLAACSSRPIEEISLADVALKAAQKNKADVLAPDVFRRAENYYLRSKKDYQDGYFDSSRKYANEARLAAEQAEYKALLKQTQVKPKTLDDPGSGDIPPEPLEPDTRIEVEK